MQFSITFYLFLYDRENDHVHGRDDGVHVHEYVHARDDVLHHDGDVHLFLN